jgi:beta-lactamase regulating signal transducer with metallopeptidase domain
MPTLALIDLSGAATTLLTWVGLALLFGTLLAAATWVVLRTALREARPALHAALWIVVLIKFIVPIGPAWMYPPAGAVLDSARSLWRNMVGTESAPPTASPADIANRQHFAAVFSIPLAPEAGAAPSATDAWTAWPWSTLLAGAYLVGVVTLAAVRLRAYVRFAAACRPLPLAEETVRARVAEICRRHGLRPPCVRVSDSAPAPFVLNAFRPTLVLSRFQLDDADELDAVVLHEIAHLRRRDLLVRYLQWFVGTLLYFWPVVAWVNRRIDLAREHACDEWALRHGRLSPARYARCLLRAMQPVRPEWGAFVPAAMAANASFVERRIEMIMKSTSHAGRGRLVGLLAGAGLLGWLGFALAGASAALIVKPGPAARTVVAADGTVQQDCLFVVQSVFGVGNADGGDPDVVPVFGFPCDPFAAGDVQMFVTEDADEDGTERRAFTIALSCESDDALTAQFGAERPAADADGDGAVSRVERDAYLIAVAMTSPKTVLEKYPQADRNSDGALDAAEAARLIAGGWMPTPKVLAAKAPDMISLTGGHAAICLSGDDPIPADVLKQLPPEVAAKLEAARSGAATEGKQIRVIRKIENRNGEVTEETQVGDAAPVVRVYRADEGGDGKRPEEVVPGRCAVRVIARAPRDGEQSTESGSAVETVECVAGAPAIQGLPEPASIWLLKNIDAAPTSADVRRYTRAADEAPLALFFEHNPAADADQDGKLTAEERDRFIEKHRTAMRERILQRHPQADANADGILSDDELKEFFRAHAPAGAMRVPIECVTETSTNAAADATTRRCVIIRKSEDGADGKEIEVEVTAECGPPAEKK